MSELRADTITGSDGSSPVTLTKQSAAKAYQHFDTTGPTMHKSLNLSASTDHGTGDFTANFTSSWDDVRYMLAHGHDDDGFNDATIYSTKGVTWATGSLRYIIIYGNQAANSFFDSSMAQIVWHGDLA